MKYVSEIIFKTLYSSIASPDLLGLAQSEELQCMISDFICKSTAMNKDDGSYFFISDVIINRLMLLILTC